MKLKLLTIILAAFLFIQCGSDAPKYRIEQSYTYINEIYYITTDIYKGDTKIDFENIKSDFNGVDSVIAIQYSQAKIKIEQYKSIDKTIKSEPKKFKH